MNKILIQEFLENEYSNSALYNCYRAIGSYVDGLKPSARKVVYTIRDKNINSEDKVSRLASLVSQHTEYLHGEVSLQGVIVNMAQDFVGTNNISLLSPNGNFGSRHIPTPSASRYIFTKKSKDFDLLFMKEDDAILDSQEFEGKNIEPKFLAPILPLILINGSEGMGTGYAQKIFPRDPKEISEAIKDLVEKGVTNKKLKPFYKGFKGKVIQGENPGQWEFQGLFTLKNTSTIVVTELPVTYTLTSYTKILNKLQEDGVIKSYEDLSENDEFLFNLKVSRSFTKKDYGSILNKLKLVKRATENYTCIDENNAIVEFETAEDILKSFIKIRLDYYEKRRLYIIELLNSEIENLQSINLFIEKIIKGKIKINNKKKAEIISQIELQNKYSSKKIIQKDDSYDYLLKMPLYSLTEERVLDLQKRIADKEEQKGILERETPKALWKTDIKQYFKK